jgi:hypothetical protein
MQQILGIIFNILELWNVLTIAGRCQAVALCNAEEAAQDFCFGDWPEGLICL